MSLSSDASAVRAALVDDDSGLLTVLDRRLDALGWEREVLSYAAGPEQIAALRVHVLIVNPALTGLDYIERISSSLPGLALIVCSGPAPVAERVRALRGGADDWVTKPLPPRGAPRARPGRSSGAAGPARSRPATRSWPPPS